MGIVDWKRREASGRRARTAGALEDRAHEAEAMQKDRLSVMLAMSNGSTEVERRQSVSRANERTLGSIRGLSLSKCV